MAYSLLSPPLAPSPEAGFIAASAASQIITNDHDAHAAMWYDQHGIEPSGEPAVISPAALQLVNNFLDQLLFNILSKSRSTSLSALRPAVAEVLKPKLAKDAINQADEELREYLGGGDEDDLLQQGNDPSRDWDLELVWKRTRLRCMVYSSLGDLEEEDEDYYMDREGLDLDGNEELFDVISPAVAIFLTSILEYMGEQALVVAGQGAYHRLQSRFQKEVASGTRERNHVADRVVIDELDMDRVALDRTLGRLWRAWKKRIRSPTLETRPYSRSSGPILHFRQNSLVPSEFPLTETPAANAEGIEGIDEKPTVEPQIEAWMEAMAIPLPMGERDVDEIEVPGLVSYSDDEDEAEEESESASPRPQSVHLASPLASPTLTFEIFQRQRSKSLPGLAMSEFSLRGPLLDISEEAPSAVKPLTQDSPEEPVVDPVDSTEEPETGEVKADGVEQEAKPAIEPPVVEVDDDDVEHFEILTTSRISISGGTSPSIPDSDGTHSRSSSRHNMRPASISSPRLIEVSGLKGPVSRSATVPLDTDLAPPAHAADDNPQKTQAVETIYRSPISSPASRSPADKFQRPARSPVSAAISEVAEGSDALSVRAESSPRTSPALANIYTGDQSQFTHQTHGGYSRRRQGLPSPIQEHTYTGTKVTIIPESDSTGVEDGSVPPIPPRRDAASNRNYASHTQDRARPQPPANASVESIGAVTIERNGAKQDISDAAHSIPPRPIHTSGSTASSSTNRLKPVRTSEESHPGAANPEYVARNFEDLIQSDQTIQYTLTPENMRDIDVSTPYEPLSWYLARKSNTS
jgi:hypothetical protein